MSCKVSLISQAGGDWIWAGAVQHRAGEGHECHCPQAISEDSAASHSTVGQDNKAKTPEIQGLCCAGGAGWDSPLVTLGMAQIQDPTG